MQTNTMSSGSTNGRMSGEIMLGILFIVYLIMGYKTPAPLAKFINTSQGTVVIVLLFLSLFLFSNPILAVVGLFVGFELVRRSRPTDNNNTITPIVTTITDNSDKEVYSSTYTPNAQPLFNNEQKKTSYFTAENQFPYTLEQEVVKNMAPSTGPMGLVSPSNADYQPILEEIKF